MMAEDVGRMAQALARNCGFACFPVRLIRDKKLPARSKKHGGHGFKDATKDPDQITFLWKHWPAM